MGESDSRGVATVPIEREIAPAGSAAVEQIACQHGVARTETNQRNGHGEQCNRNDRAIPEERQAASGGDREGGQEQKEVTREKSPTERNADETKQRPGE